MKKLFTLLMFCAVTFIALADKQVNGVVEDSKGEPIVGATIQAPGTSIGTITDYDGVFSISVPDGQKTLLVTFVGMEPQEVAVKSNVRVTLHEAAVAIEEVVAYGYGSTTKGSFAGSAQAVDADAIDKKSPSEISKALAGEVSGVTVVNTSGQPGTNAMIRIRGYGSINAGSAPLYVVDGIPYDGDVSSIDPGDIASTTILKDATATSLYGSRGANGVILITTKKGTSGEQGKIDVDVKYGMNSRFLPMHDVIESPEEYVEMAWMALYNTSAMPKAESKAKDASKQLFSESGKGLPAVYNLWDSPGTGLIDNTGHFYPDVMRKPAFQQMDSWRDAIFRIGQKAEASVKISGGSEKTTYFTSFSYLKDEGYYISSDYDRFTVRSNINHEAKKWLKGGLNLAYTYSQMNNPGQGSNMNNGFAYVNGVPAIYPVYEYDADGNVLKDPKTGGLMYDYGMHEGYGRYFGTGINPAGSLRYDAERTIGHQVVGNAFFEIKFYKDLKLTANIGVQYLGQTYSELTNPFYGDAAGIGRIAKDQLNILAFTANQLLEYDKTFGDAHTVHAMAGHESAFQLVNEFYGSKSHLADPSSLELGNAVLMTSLSSASNQFAIESYLANVTYNYDERYYLTANYRADGSSKFARGHRWGHFGSIGGAWRFTNEDFFPMEAKEWIKDGKLRLSWGKLGNQDVGSNLFSDQYAIENVDGEVGYIWGYKGSKDITWEETSQWDLGLEFSLKKYLDIELDYYHKNTTNLFFPKYIGPSIGYGYTYINDGEMYNQGVEFEVKAHLVDERNVKLDVRLNGAHNENKVTKLPKAIDTSGASSDMNYGGYSEGHSIFEYSIPEYVGVDKETGMALYKTYYDSDLGSFGAYNSAATLLSQHKPGQNYISDYDQYLLLYPERAGFVRDTVTTVATAVSSKFTGKTALAALSGGIGIDLEVYGVDFSINCSYGIGGWGYDNTYAQLMGSGKVGNYNWHTDMRGAWNAMMTDEEKQAIADLGSAGIPRLSNGVDTYTDYASSRFMTSNSYFSLNNVRIGYKFQKKLIEKIKLNFLEIYATGENLAIATARKGYNPMTSYTGSSNAYQYTPLSTIMGGIKFQF